MLNSLRQGSPIFMLRISQPELSIEQGTVEATNAQLLGMGMFNPYPIDITVRAGSRSVSYRGLPGNADTAAVREQTTGDELILASSQDAMDREVERLKQESVSQLNRVEYHQQRVMSCDRIHAQLHPEEAAKAQQQKEIEDMRMQMGALREQLSLQAKQMAEQAEINKRLLDRLQSDAPTLSKPKSQNEHNDHQNAAP